MKCQKLDLKSQENIFEMPKTESSNFYTAWAGKRLKCDSCEFKAKNQNGLNMHKKAKHGDKSA